MDLNEQAQCFLARRPDVWFTVRQYYPEIAAQGPLAVLNWWWNMQPTPGSVEWTIRNQETVQNDLQKYLTFLGCSASSPDIGLREMGTIQPVPITTAGQVATSQLPTSQGEVSETASSACSPDEIKVPVINACVKQTYLLVGGGVVLAVLLLQPGRRRR